MPARNYQKWNAIPGKLNTGEYVDSRIYSDRDIFKELSPKDKIQFKLLKDIKKGDSLYRRLSKSQKQITNLINDYDKSEEILYHNERSNTQK